MNAIFDWLCNEKPQTIHRVAGALSQAERNEFAYHWEMQARSAQLPPKGEWRTWLIMAGRGFGKTRAGAEWVRMIAETHPEARIALVATSLAEARAVMVEGESGLLACSPAERRPIFEASLKRITFPNGAEVRLYSAAEPESLRGPQHSHAWCDEVGKWPVSHDRAMRVWDNLQMGLRIGRDPRIAVTTTPRAVPLVQRLLDGEAPGNTIVSRGSTFDNAANLPGKFLDAVTQEYGGTQLARQEIAGEMLRDIEGALWSRSLIERTRHDDPTAPSRRVVVAVDPPAGTNGDECGIVVASLGEDGIARVLADCSVSQAMPDVWAKAVAAAAEQWDADRVVAEANQGGAMVESVLRAANSVMPVKLVHASRGKVARAEPVAALYAAGRVRHCGVFAQLEDHRADALVWALNELMLGPASRPSVRSL